MEGLAAIKHLVKRIYGENKGEQALHKILPLIEAFAVQKSQGTGYFSQEDVVLITYGDTLNRGGEAPLATLHGFASEFLKDAISTLHFLPFFPYSSDDGFSVMDFLTINPELGSWQDVTAMGKDFSLMFDYVVNHFSSKSQWFKYYLESKEGFEDFAIEVDPMRDLSMVTRPRSLPLLSAYKKRNGETAHLWTTFSADQIDFNFESPDVLAKMIEVLLFYVAQGATILRLDAIAYLWKEIGTNCIHLSRTHDMVKLFRSILDRTAPDVILLTETNVPHDENISYFGNGRDEAQMAYNFTLPPLLFYTFVKEDASVLSEWAMGLHLDSETNTFFNFTASHDGIGVRPLEGILAQEDLADLIEIVQANGGKVSYKQNPDGSESPYELNITYLDAILADSASGNAARFLASQAIQYVLPGVPATYIHSLLGSRNWTEGVKQTGRARTINREKLQIEKVLEELKHPESFRSKVFFPYLELIKIRTRQQAFHPNAAFEILETGPKLFAIKRECEDQTIYALTNISSQQISVSLSDHGVSGQMTDVLTSETYTADAFDLKPYQYVWLTGVN
ncbi:sugar phosphorylase [Thermodesulfobacteriota bacterium]